MTDVNEDEYTKTTAPQQKSRRVQTLKVGAAAQMLPLVAGYGVNLLATPYVVVRLGLHDFGIWSITGAMAQYLALFDLGVSRAANRYVALFHARGDADSERSVDRVCVTAVLVLGCLLSSIPLLVAGLLDRVLGTGDPQLAQFLLYAAISMLVCGLFAKALAAASIGRGRQVSANVGVAVLQVAQVVGGLVSGWPSRLDSLPATLIDSNADLVGVYTALAREPSRVIDCLHELSRRHATGAADHYYQVRGEHFNGARRAAARARYARRLHGTAGRRVPVLNRTCFNGLFRLNSSGEFNVPVGRYANPRICDERNLMRVATLLGQPNVFIFLGSFERLRTTAEPGEFIYFDPPYAPVSATASFRSYTAEGFSDHDQVRLQQLVIELARRGCAVLVSNSVAPQITALYENNIEARRAGLRAHRVPARRAINRNAALRGPVEEYLISNV